MALDEHETGTYKKCQVKWTVFTEIYEELKTLYYEVHHSEKHGYALSQERHKVASSGW